jgi:uncharacterized membrane protein (DUF485 family)
MKSNNIQSIITGDFFREHKHKFSLVISISLFLFSVLYPSLTHDVFIWPKTDELTLAVLLAILPFFFEFYLTTIHEIKWIHTLEKVFSLHPSRRDLLDDLIKEHLKNDEEKLINTFAMRKIKEKYDDFTNEVVLSSICNHHLTFYGAQARYTDLELVSSNWKELRAVTFLESRDKCKLRRYQKIYLETQIQKLQSNLNLKIKRIYILCTDLVENGIPVAEAQERLKNEMDNNIDVYWIVNDSQFETSEINDSLIVDTSIISISDLTSGDIDKITLSWDNHVINKYLRVFEKILGESQKFI